MCAERTLADKFQKRDRVFDALDICGVLGLPLEGFAPCRNLGRPRDGKQRIGGYARLSEKRNGITLRRAGNDGGLPG